MKKFLITTMALMPLITHAQKIAENKVDDFTHNTIKRTNWELLYRGNLKNPGSGFFRISKINNNATFDLKMSTGDVRSVDKDMQLMFRLDNDSIVSINNYKYTLSCAGCGARGFAGHNVEGLDLTYYLPADAIARLKNHTITKFRVYTSDGYEEYAINEKESNAVFAAINLVQ